jgi:hypothetical protein
MIRAAATPKRKSTKRKKGREVEKPRRHIGGGRWLVGDPQRPVEESGEMVGMMCHNQGQQGDDGAAQPKATDRFAPKCAQRATQPTKMRYIPISVLMLQLIE